MNFYNKLIVHGLVKVNNKYLVIKRTEFKRGKPNHYPLYWDIPGGLVEEGELPKCALIRETKEEVNLDITVGKLIHEDSNFDKEKNSVFTRLVYICNVINQDEKDILLQEDEHSEYRLINNLAEMEKELIAPFLEKIFKDISEV